jgi:hypothetical protein
MSVLSMHFHRSSSYMKDITTQTFYPLIECTNIKSTKFGPKEGQITDSECISDKSLLWNNEKKTGLSLFQKN